MLRYVNLLIKWSKDKLTMIFRRQIFSNPLTMISLCGIRVILVKIKVN